MCLAKEPGKNVGAGEHQYLYNNKELNTDWDINLYEYGARWYDPAVGRWTAIDPMSESFYSLSPFNYGLNNPIRVIDPDGAFAHLVQNTSGESIQAKLEHTSNESKQKRKEFHENPTLDVVIANASSTSTNDLVDSFLETKRIMKRNGIEENVQYRFTSEEYALNNLPGVLRHEDRTLFLALTTANNFRALGASQIHPTIGFLDIHDGKRFLSGLDVDDFKNRYKIGWEYALGYTMAHEFAHQLDAFALMSLEGNLRKRGPLGHYEGRDSPNLLMDGQLFNSSIHTKGGVHELLPIEVKRRVHEYLSK